MADYLLDTNIVTYWYNRKCPQNKNVINKITQVRQPDPQTGYVSRILISVVTLAEVEYGHKVTASPDPEAQTAYRKFIAEELPPALEIPRLVHEPYALLRSWLFNNFSSKHLRTRAKRPEELVNPTTARELGIDENDLWIAAHAALYNLVLVTADGLANLKEAINGAGVGPELEDWTKT
jgi:predicted nucleic acid-binding protein